MAQPGQLSKADSLGLFIFRLFRDFYSRHDKFMAEQNLAGLRGAHSAVTVYLAQRPHRLSELAKLNEMRPQSMLKLVNELEALGYVERVQDPKDSRAKLVQFTRSGKRLLAASSEASREAYVLYRALLQEDNVDIDSFLHELNRLLDKIEARKLSPDNLKGLYSTYGRS